MNEKIKAKWLKALRSGEYEQGARALCRVDGDSHKFCCLGVLINEVGGFDFVPRRGKARHGTKTGMPVRVFQEKLGIANHAYTLASMNDCGNSFSKIADYIEKNL